MVSEVRRIEAYCDLIGLPKDSSFPTGRGPGLPVGGEGEAAAGPWSLVGAAERAACTRDADTCLRCSLTREGLIEISVSGKGAYLFME